VHEVFLLEDTVEPVTQESSADSQLLRVKRFLLFSMNSIVSAVDGVSCISPVAETGGTLIVAFPEDSVKTIPRISSLGTPVKLTA